MIIKNGTVITACETYKADILVEGEKIRQIAENINPPSGCEVIDASGLEIYPGAIDVHTHLDMPCGNNITTADDFESGTMAAACGGTTTIIDFANPKRGQRLSDALAYWRERSDGNSAVDYAFHITLVEVNDRVASEVAELVEKEGITSFKTFFAYAAMRISDIQFLEILDLAKKHGALVTLHAENGDILEHSMKKLHSEGKSGPEFHEAAHPAIAESEAIHRGIALAQYCRMPLYIVHLSSNEGLDEIKAARAAGLPVYAETCPQYLLLSNQLYHKNGFEAAKYVMSPPLRAASGNDIIWNALRDGFIQVIATDHCSFMFKGQKDIGKNDFTKIPNGAPGIGERVNLIYSYGVKKGKISKNRFAAVMSTNPAKLFGLYPRKGSIAVGSDADFTLIDPGKKGAINIKDLNYKADYSAYENFSLDGMVTLTISRGKIIAKGSNFCGVKTHGKYLKRSKFNCCESII
ncbi:MAG TPA: dihydropyrimidinase [Candidatus Wallbacteria bacterium]|nr:dihydropyrimidinase [Candidatus Wallbacteria bacterium]